MQEVNKQIKVIAVTGGGQEATVQEIEEAHEVTVLTPHDIGEMFAESADTRDVNATSEAELGTESFVLRVLGDMPDGTVAVLYELSAADISLLQAQYGSDFLQLDNKSDAEAVADFLNT